MIINQSVNDNLLPISTSQSTTEESPKPYCRFSFIFISVFIFLAIVTILLYAFNCFLPYPKLQNVLIIVDMQNDYCKECNSSTVSKWALKGLPSVAQHINDLHTVHFDQYVFTQDWLPTGSPFLQRHTFGSELIKALKIPNKSLTFTKSSDDWMNNLGPKTNCSYCTPSYDNQYHFALNKETTKKFPKHPTLVQYLSFYGYDPENTRLVVTGIAENRCVMKGSVHAIEYGYRDVLLYLPGTGATNVTEPENWNPGTNAPKDSCELTFNVVTCTEEQEKNWREQVYTGRKGGPTSRDAIDIMMNSNEKIIKSKKELCRILGTCM